MSTLKNQLQNFKLFKFIIVFISIISIFLIYAQAADLDLVKTLFSSFKSAKALPHGVCNSCHINHTSPSAQLTMVGGNANLCMSCHNPVGLANGMPFTNAMKAVPGVSGNSHAWNIISVNATFETNLTTYPEMLSRLVNDTIICSTCHNQHSQTYPPFLRSSNDADAMCKNCHSVRNIMRYIDNPANKGSHPVGITYPVADTLFFAAPQNSMVLVNSKVECSSCHSVHNASTNDGYILRQTNDDVLCMSCHKYSSHQGMGCSTCHQTHNPDKTNIFMVRSNILTPNSGTKAVVFTATTGANSFADGDATYNGVCEVCHTGTTYHQNSSAGNHAHNVGLDCINCHPHSNAFMPSGGTCTDCHNSVQDNGDGIPVGGRRAIVGEFPVSNAHAHYGVTLNSNACIVCHKMDNHQSGYVELIDPDNSSTYQFLKADSLHTDPDVSNFCMNCHDADGATRLTSPLDPFGNGNVPPEVASKFSGTLQWNEWYGDLCWGNEGTLRGVNSHHDISDADQAFSGAKLECLNCHGSHLAAQSAPLADPFNLNIPWAGTDNGFCISCHNGGTSPATPEFPANVIGPTIPLRGLESCNYGVSPWWVDYRWTNSSHGSSSKRGWPGYSGAPQYDMSCMVCHDSHGSYTLSNTAGNPYMIRDVVDGSSFVDDGDRATGPWTGPPWNTFGINRTVKITITGVTVDWAGAQGLCNVCHANWYNASTMSHDCGGCQFCHGHGQTWGENDWVGSNDAPCPAKKQLEFKNILNGNNKPPLHFNSK